MICALWTAAVFWLAVTVTGRIAAQETRSAATAEGNGWPEYGGNLAGQRYSSEKQVTPANVGRLQTAWVVHTHVFDTPSKASNWRASSEATPVLWRRTLYFDTPFDEIFAVDAETGKVRWTFDPAVNRQKSIYIVTSRGVSLWHAKRPGRGVCESDRVLVATLDRRLIARDANTGQACTGFGDNGTVDLSRGVQIANLGYYGFTSPPTIVGNTIILGSSVADNQAAYVASGAIRGFDAITGRQNWSWDPVRWNANQHPKVVGSGNAWSVISADADHDLVFVPTGSPSVDYYGGLRLGDNRDADSIVALRASTGERVWAFQLVHHDIWDYDTPSEPVLFTFRGTIPAVAVATKSSMVYVFNRLTGEPLYPVVERPVPRSHLIGEEAWATQPFSTLPPLTPLNFTTADIHLHNPSDQAYCEQVTRGLENQGLFTPPSANGSLVFPGPAGGANWGSSAFDPATSILYTRASSIPFLVKEVLKPPLGREPWIRAERLWMRHAPWWAGGFPPRPLSSQFRTPDSGGEERDESGQEGTPYVLQRQAIMTPNGVPCAPAPFGSIVAMNLATRQKVWSVAHGEMAQGEPGSIGVGGVIVTAGGLLFAASTNDPYLRAYDSASGKEVWRGTLPVASNATPMTYGVNGRQYVVIAAGGHGFIGTGKADEVIAFALPKSKSKRVK